MKKYLFIIATVASCLPEANQPTQKYEAMNALDYAADADCLGGYNVCIKDFLNNKQTDTIFCVKDYKYCNIDAWEAYCELTKNKCLHDCMISCSVHIARDHQVAFDACQNSCIGDPN